MAKAIRKLFRVVLRLEYPRSIFDMSPGGMRYYPPAFEYPSTEESWRRDWENIGSDFRRAVSRLDSELSHV